jgi:hypothetical protein
MNGKRFILAGLAGFAVLFAIGALWHIVALGNFYAAHSKFTIDNMAFVIIGLFLTGFLLSFIYPLGYRGKSPALEGYRFGILMGAVWMVPTGFVIFLGAGIMSPNAFLVDFLWHILVEEGIAGLVIGLIYGKKAS